MKPWVELDRSPVPGGDGELVLRRRDTEYAICLDGVELMSSRAHASEELLAERSCARLAGQRAPRLLLGGLGMGFTLAAALRGLGPDAAVVVAELLPAVARWNRGPLGALAGHPLEDPRVTLVADDVRLALTRGGAPWTAILLDVDNGPSALTRASNAWLYAREGLAAAHAALAPRGVLAVWSAGPDRAFAARLRETGFAVETVGARAHAGGGRRHTLWLATR